jgi:TatD DNase family protein
MFIDTHTHLFVDAFNEDRDEVVQRAIDAGVEWMLLPNIDTDTIVPLLQLSQRFPQHCLPMMGLHPGSVDADWEVQLEAVREALYSGKYIAVGEIGMDLYWDKTFVPQQREVFREQVSWAKDLKLPIVIHAREAFAELFAILDEINDADLSGVFHCFTGSAEEAAHILSYGNFMMGIGGVVTYKKANLEESLKNVPLSSLVLETDSPYLTPVPFRGKRNESAYLLHIAEKLAEIYGLSLREIEKVTTENALRLFNLSSSINGKHQQINR